MASTITGSRPRARAATAARAMPSRSSAASPRAAPGGRGTTGRPASAVREAIEHEAERGVGLLGERGREDDRREIGAGRARGSARPSRARRARTSRWCGAGARRARRALRGAAGAEERDVAGGGVDGDAREAEDVAGDGRDRRRVARRAARSTAAGAREPREGGDVRGLEAREIERERRRRARSALRRRREAAMKARTRAWSASLSVAENTAGLRRRRRYGSLPVVKRLRRARAASARRSSGMLSGRGQREHLDRSGRR